MSYTAISLFSGCGGFDLGLAQLGHTVIWANDKMKAAAQVYKASFPDVEFCEEDIRKVATFPKAQLLVGCYPCQGYSVGGARNKEKPTNKLYLEFARALSLVQPYFFVSENVHGVKALFDGYFLQQQIDVFSQAGPLGYRVYPLFLDAKDYGVPQQRKRIFLVGVRSDLNFTFETPRPTHGPKSPGEKPYETLRKTIGHLEEWPSNESLVCWQGSYNWYYFSRNRRRGWEEVSYTILANKRHVPLHPSSTPLRFKEKDVWEFTEEPARYRRLSYKECALIQTINLRELGDVQIRAQMPRMQITKGTVAERLCEDQFPRASIVDPLQVDDSISLAKAYEVVGNAVPPTLSKAVLSGLPHPDQIPDLISRRIF